MTQNYRDFP